MQARAASASCRRAWSRSIWSPSSAKAPSKILVGAFDRRLPPGRCGAAPGRARDSPSSTFGFPPCTAARRLRGTVDAGYLLDDHAALSSTVPFSESAAVAGFVGTGSPGANQQWVADAGAAGERQPISPKPATPPSPQAPSCLRPPHQARRLPTCCGRPCRRPRTCRYVGEMQTSASATSTARLRSIASSTARRTCTRKWYLAPRPSTATRPSRAAAFRSPSTSSAIASSSARTARSTTPDVLAGQTSTCSSELSGRLRTQRDVRRPSGARDHASSNKYTGETAIARSRDAQNDLVLERSVFASNGSVVEGERASSTFAIRTTSAGGLRDAGQDGRRPRRRAHQAVSDVNAIANTAGFAARTPPYLPEASCPSRATSWRSTACARSTAVLRRHPHRLALRRQGSELGGPAALSSHRRRRRPGRRPIRRARLDAACLVWTAAGVHYSLVGRPHPTRTRKNRRLLRGVAPAIKRRGLRFRGGLFLPCGISLVRV